MEQQYIQNFIKSSKIKCLIITGGQKVKKIMSTNKEYFYNSFWFNIIYITQIKILSLRYLSIQHF